MDTQITAEIVPYNTCLPYCPRCLAIKWAQYIIKHGNSYGRDTAEVIISLADWSALKELAEEKVE